MIPQLLLLALAFQSPAGLGVQRQTVFGSPVASVGAPLDAILVILDDVGAGDAPPSVAPNLAALAAGGISFSNAFANPVCSQTRTCLHFGVLGRSIGILTELGPTIPPSPIPPAGAPTLAGEFAAAGYATCLVGKWHAGHAPSRPDGSEWPLAPGERGFQTMAAVTRANVASGGFYSWDRVDGTGTTYQQAVETRYATLAQIEAAEAWWNATGSPRLLVVSLNDAHYPPEQPPQELSTLPWPQPPFPPSAALQMHHSKVRSADTVIGRLMVMPGASAAIFGVVGDNGTPLGPPGPNHGKGTTFDPGVRVPLVMRWPGCTAGSVYPELVHVVDVPAAMLEVAGIPVPISWDGRTWPPRKHVICEADGLGPASSTLDRCARGKRYKLRNVATPMNPAGVESLFDLQNDPGELSPLDLGAPSIQSKLAALRAVLY